MMFQRALFVSALFCAGWATGNFAQTPAAPEFEVASIKISTDPPGHSGLHTSPASLRIQNSTLKECIMYAYHVQDFQISGGPKELESDRYNIDAKAAGAANDEQLMSMLQSLLAARFHVVFHRESRTMQGYALVLAKGGLKIKPSEAEDNNVSSHSTGNSLTAMRMSMDKLAAAVAHYLEIPVADFTGVSGVFDITLKWKSEQAGSRPPGADHQSGAPQNISAELSLPEVLQEQLGLKLEPRKVPVQILVIDAAQKPDEN